MTDANVIDRVRKILALSENAGATPGERDAALAAAARVMAQHRIEQADLDAADHPQVVGDVAAVDVGDFGPPDYWALDLLTVIGGVLTVDPVFIEDGAGVRAATLIGRSDSVAYVRLLYGYLRPQLEADAAVVVQAERGYRDLIGRPPSPDELASYRDGFYVGALGTIQQRLAALHADAEGSHGTALVVSDRAAIDAYYGADRPQQVDTIAARTLSAEAMMTGARAGQRVDLNPSNKVGPADRPELGA